MRVLAYPHVIKNPDEAAHFERVPRVRVAQIVADHLGYGWSAEEIVRQYPHLTPAEVYSGLSYYYDHRAEIERELADELAELDNIVAQPATALRLRLLAHRLEMPRKLG